MKLQAEIDGEKLDVELVRDGDSLTATVGGRSYTLEASEPEPNVFLFKNENKITEVDISAVSPGLMAARVGTHEFQVKLIDPKRLRGTAGESDAIDGRAEIRTAMPGKVVRVIAAVGDQVEKGDGIVVVEAMKMQNELKSPKAGTVKEIRFAEGVTVNSGDVLAVIE